MSSMRCFRVTRLTSHVTRHTSHVTRHTSHVTRHTSHVTRRTSHVTRHTVGFTSHVTRHSSGLGQLVKRAVNLSPGTRAIVQVIPPLPSSPNTSLQTPLHPQNASSSTKCLFIHKMPLHQQNASSSTKCLFIHSHLSHLACNAAHRAPSPSLQSPPQVSQA